MTRKQRRHQVAGKALRWHHREWEPFEKHHLLFKILMYSI